MGIRIYAQLHSGIPGSPRIDIIEVKPSWIGIDLQSSLRPGGDFQDRRHVQVIRLALIDDPACRMPDYVHVFVFHGRDDPSSDRPFALLLAHVNRGHNHIAPGQKFIRIIQSSVSFDVHLGACQNCDALQLFVGLFHSRELLFQPLRRQAASYSDRRRMIA